MSIIAVSAAAATVDSGMAQTKLGGERVPPLISSAVERNLSIISPALLSEDAKRILSPESYEYIHGGAGDEWTMAQNIERLRATGLRPRRMAGFSKADTASNFLASPVAAPLFVCPMGAQDYAHPDAELASAQGASRAGIPYILSSASNHPLEEVASVMAAGAPRLFAIYLNTEESVNRSLAKRARAAGYLGIVLTVDSLGPGTSERFVAMGAPQTTIGGYGNFDPARGGTGRFLDLKKNFSPDDIGMMQDASGLPVLVKGLLRSDDADRAVAAGAAGLIVSNHGGRTLDGAPAAIDALAAIVAKVGGRVPVMFDSGVRRGTDVVRALAMGASAVGIGRPVLDALALGGSLGVSDLLEWFKTDLATQMLQVGVRRVAELPRAQILHDRTSKC